YQMKQLFILFFICKCSLLQAQHVDGYYMRYEGSIGKKNAITADLFFADTIVIGHYYYSGSSTEFFIHGAMKNFQLTLKEHDDTTVTGYLSGKVATDFSTIDGTWSDISKSKKLPFKLNLLIAEGSAKVNSIKETLTYIWQETTGGDPVGCTATYTYCYLPEMLQNPAFKTINEELLDIDLEGDENSLKLKSLAEGSMADEFDSYIESYQETFPDSIAAKNKMYIDKSPYIYKWNYERTYEVTNNEHAILCVKISGHSYEGGVQGNSTLHYQVFNLQTGELISLEEIFNKATVKELTAIAEKQLRENRKINENISLTESGFFVKRLELKEEFFINHSGIGFTYNPDEIAPATRGPVTIFIKWEQVKSLINPGGPLGWVLQ
ncbi:MAG: DUF3298 domain-containing protein, partial [Chitinophagales bacterium]